MQPPATVTFSFTQYFDVETMERCLSKLLLTLNLPHTITVKETENRFGEVLQQMTITVESTGNQNPTDISSLHPNPPEY